MTSGAIAGFLDVAYNFNTQALLDDNILGMFEIISSGGVQYQKLFEDIQSFWNFRKHNNCYFFLSLVRSVSKNRLANGDAWG